MRGYHNQNEIQASRVARSAHATPATVHTHQTIYQLTPEGARRTLRTSRGVIVVEGRAHGWRPGEPIPEGVQVNAALALVRHADATENFEREQAARVRRAA